MYKESMYGVAKVAIPKGEIGHEKAPMKCDVLGPQKSDMGRLKKMPMPKGGYPQKAWDYKY